MSDSAHIFHQYVAGDSQAADELFYRYVERLTRLARSRLSASMASRIDADDVVMSAYRSFFVGARDGEFAIERSGELWALLVRITLNKLHRQADHHTAQKRSVRREATDAQQLIAVEPSHEDAVELADQLEFVMRNLSKDRRRILELRLQGEPIDEIANQLDINERTVRRALAEVREQLVRSAGLPMEWSEPVPTIPKTNTDLASLPAAELAYSDYILEQQVAIGGMGRVYRTTRKSDDTTVAVKYLRKAFTQRPGAVERFVEEAQTVAEFDHPHIVDVHGFGRTPAGSVFIVMDYVRGENLSQIIQRGSVSVQQAIEWLLPICDALGHAHEKQIIHCDLKPANILIREDNTPLLTDFGLANRVGKGHLLREGTAPFMAPEQIDDHFGSIDERTDVYGIAAVLFNLVTGRPPYVGDRAEDIFAQIITAKEPPKLSSHRPDASHLDALCQQSLGPRKNRPKSITEFARLMSIAS